MYSWNTESQQRHYNKAFGWAGGGGTKRFIIIQWFSHGELFFISNTMEVLEQPVLLNFDATFFPDSRAGLTYIFGIISSLIL